MAEPKLYRCKHCGNIVLMVNDVKAPVCCGEEMELLVAGTSDGATEKHVPVVSHEGGKLVVNVGEVDHPMTEEHYIQWVALVSGNTFTITYLTPSDAPHVEFPDVTEGTVYEYCNLHGLWKTEL